MRKLFGKWFYKGQIEALQLEVERLKELWSAEAEKRRVEVSSLNRLLDTYRERLKIYDKTWKGVSKFDNDRIYFVVTQGGFYEIKGWKVNKGVMSEVTRRAVKSGFVVSSRLEAERLQAALQRLAW